MGRWLAAALLFLLFACPALAWEERVTQTGDIRRIETVDSEGNLHDTSHGYAVVEQTLDARGNVVLERYLTARGHPVKADDSYYAAAMVYDEKDHCIRVTYLDTEGKPMRCAAGYAVSEQTADEAGHIVTERYLDPNGRPAMLGPGQYGLRREAFDGEGRCLRYTYLGADGEPVMLTYGYAAVERSFDGAGYIAENRYFDVSGKPARLSLGQYGTRYAYDGYGNLTEETCLDEQGEPMTNLLGYSTAKHSWNERNYLLDETRYFGADGSPVSIGWGQYGIRYIHRKGHDTFKLPIGKNGTPLPLLHQLLPQMPRVVLLCGALLMLGALALKGRALWGLLAVYGGFMLYITILCREVRYNPVSLQPFYALRAALSSADARNQLLMNILLFVPPGCMLARLVGAKKALTVCVLASLAIEMIQMVTGLGWLETDDLIANVLGGIMGILMCLAVRRFSSALKKRKERLLSENC